MAEEVLEFLKDHEQVCEIYEGYADGIDVYMEFDSRWAPAEDAWNELWEKWGTDIVISWFYDEPGMQLAGYLGDAQ
tara:strand:- start:731 stop:958 length:228 start_codon:yes stop_codon:yes gene_type:complete